MIVSKTHRAEAGARFCTASLPGPPATLNSARKMRLQPLFWDTVAAAIRLAFEALKDDHQSLASSSDTIFTTYNSFIITLYSAARCLTGDLGRWIDDDVELTLPGSVILFPFVVLTSRKRGLSSTTKPAGLMSALHSTGFASHLPLGVRSRPYRTTGSIYPLFCPRQARPVEKPGFASPTHCIDRHLGLILRHLLNNGALCPTSQEDEAKEVCGVCQVSFHDPRVVAAERRLTAQSQCPACLKNFAAPSCKQVLLDRGCATCPAPGAGHRKFDDGSLVLAPALQAEGPLLPHPPQRTRPEHNRACPETLQALQGALLVPQPDVLSLDAVLRAYHSHHSCFRTTCLPQSRIRATLLVWKECLSEEPMRMPLSNGWHGFLKLTLCFGWFRHKGANRDLLC